MKTAHAIKREKRMYSSGAFINVKVRGIIAVPTRDPKETYFHIRKTITKIIKLMRMTG
jgi:hypothetical protein